MDHAPRLRLLVATNDFPPRAGGIQTYLAQLLAGLDAEVTVVAPAQAGDAAYDAGLTYRVRRYPGGWVLPGRRYMRFLVDAARAAAADVVLFGAPLPLALAGPAVRRATGSPYLVLGHGAELVVPARLPVGRQLLRRGLAQADGVVVTTPYAAALVRGVAPDVTPVVIGAGVDLDRFRPGRDGRPVRDRHRVGRNPVVFCVSRFSARKGQDKLVRAAARLARTGTPVDLLFAGTGRRVRKVQRLDTRLGTGAVFAGEVSDAELPEYHAAADVFAMPCRTRWWGMDVEGLGLVFLEAQACARPVVAGRSGGAPTALVDGETGHVVDGADPADIARALADLCFRPDRSDLGLAGRRFVEKEWAWPDTRGRLLAACGAALERRTATG